MFFYDSTGFFALVCLLVQCGLAWVFAVFFGVLSPGRPVWLRSFFVAFLGLAAALTAMALRYMLPKLMVMPAVDLGQGQPLVRMFFGIYLAGKILFVAGFLCGVTTWRGRERNPAIWMMTVAVAVGFVVGFALPVVKWVLCVQAVFVIAVCVASARMLRPRDARDKANPGRATVRLVVVLMVLGSTIYLLASLPEGFIPAAVRTACDSVVRNNAGLDLALQVVLGTGLIVAVMIDAQDKILLAHEERDRLRGRLQRDDKLRASATLISGVAHEINNPLTAIIGYGEDLSSEDESVRVHAVQVIRHQAARCCAIVKRMSAIGQRKLLATSSFRVLDLVESVVDGMRMQLADHGVEVSCDVPPKLIMVADAAGFEQVLTNLLSNAMHVSSPKQVIEILAEPAAEGVVLSVRDHGPGVPETARSQVFEPFWTTKRPSHGTGLGLAVVDAIMHAHSGKVEVADGEGGGAVFRATWPWRSPSGSESQTPIPSVAPQPISKAARLGSRLLVIDDEQSVRMTIRRYAEIGGWKVDEAVSAEAGLTWLFEDEQSYDVIICDIRMPGMSGIEFHDKLRARAPELLGSILFVTGDVASHDIAAFGQRVDADILAKPFVAEELMRRLNDIVVQARFHSET